MRKPLLVFVVAGLLMAPAYPAMAAPPEAAVVAPIDGYFERQTVKTFGTLVNAEFHQRNRAIFPNNGLPNQFGGYHAGVDIEYREPADLSAEVPVRAIADGQVVYVGSVAGYGGLIIVRHAQPESITSLYGHVRAIDWRVKRGDTVHKGQTLAFLGAQFTSETSGARKHLHFGIHKGPAVDLAGHEPTVAILSQGWYDPNAWLRGRGVAAVVAPTPPAPTTAPSPSASPSPVAVPSPPAAPPEKSIFKKILDFFGNLFA